MSARKKAEASSFSTDSSISLNSVSKQTNRSATTAASSIPSNRGLWTPKSNGRPPGTCPIPEPESGRTEQNPAANYPAVEITRVEQTEWQAIDALCHIERGRPGLTSAIAPKFPLGAQGQDNATILTYIRSLEKKVAELQGSRSGKNGQLENTATPIAASQNLNDSRADLAAKAEECRPALHFSRPSMSKPWVVEVKRYKKLNYRFGSAELYDDSEEIEEIREREAAARGGGHVIKFYKEYDC